MDKIWWNEQWMGWPIGPQYAASSNVEHAHNLQGNVLLVVGELDTNVDPASTYQVADALIKANKDFDFITVPGAGHGSVGRYEERKRFDYFVEHLQGGSTPAWNQMADSEADTE
jgi:dipeptidyl aminopeptidase/acylaminoacyl peptidase